MKSVLWLSCFGPQRINPLLIITTLLLETLLKSAYNQICNHDIKIQEECFDSKVVTGCDDIVAGCLNTNELLGPTLFHLELDVTSEMASGSNLNHKHHQKVSFL